MKSENVVHENLEHNGPALDSGLVEPARELHGELL
jgi:hypothetical protein